MTFSSDDLFLVPIPNLNAATLQFSELGLFGLKGGGRIPPPLAAAKRQMIRGGAPRKPPNVGSRRPIGPRGACKRLRSGLAFGALCSRKAGEFFRQRGCAAAPGELRGCSP